MIGDKKIHQSIIYRDGLIIDKTKTISDEEIKEQRKILREVNKNESQTVTRKTFRIK